MLNCVCNYSSLLIGPQEIKPFKLQTLRIFSCNISTWTFRAFLPSLEMKIFGTVITATLSTFRIGNGKYCIILSTSTALAMQASFFTIVHSIKSYSLSIFNLVLFSHKPWRKDAAWYTHTPGLITGLEFVSKANFWVSSTFVQDFLCPISEMIIETMESSISFRSFLWKVLT